MVEGGIFYTVVTIIVIGLIWFIREVCYLLFGEIVQRTLRLDKWVDWLQKSGGWVIVGLVLGGMSMGAAYHYNWFGCKFWKHIRYASHVQYYFNHHNVEIWEDVMDGNYQEKRLKEMTFMPGFVAEKLVNSKGTCLNCFFGEKSFKAMDDQAFELFFQKDKYNSHLVVRLENITVRQIWYLCNWRIESIFFLGTDSISPDQIKILIGSEVNYLGFFIHELNDDQMEQMVRFRGSVIVLYLDQYDNISPLSSYPGCLEIRSKKLSLEEIKTISSLQCPQLNLGSLQEITTDELSIMKNYRGQRIRLTGIKRFSRNQVEILVRFSVDKLIVNKKSFEDDPVQLEFLKVAVRFYETCEVEVVN